MRAQVILILLEIVLAGFLRPAWCAGSSDFDDARRQQDAGRHAEAEKLYRDVLKTQPRSVPSITNLGVVLARQGKYGEAVTACERVFGLAPDFLPEARRAREAFDENLTLQTANLGAVLVQRAAHRLERHGHLPSLR